MKTFDDLIFKKHGFKFASVKAKQAILFFPNGFGVSVLFGEPFYSNGIDTYELAVLKRDGNGFKLTYETPITNDVLGGLSKEEVTEAMIKVQEL